MNFSVILNFLKNQTAQPLGSGGGRLANIKPFLESGALSRSLIISFDPPLSGIRFREIVNEAHNREWKNARVRRLPFPEASAMDRNRCTPTCDGRCFARRPRVQTPFRHPLTTQNTLRWIAGMEDTLKPTKRRHPEGLWKFRRLEPELFINR